MAKVTSKLRVTIPKVLAAAFGIEPGDDIEWSLSGDTIQLSRTSKKRKLDAEARLRVFDRATLRQRAREKLMKLPRVEADRSWTREELYDRGRSR